jgi:hypothetical protein
MDYNNFRKAVLKIDKIRKHAISGSLGVYDAYKYIRKNKWFDIGKSLSEHEFYTIIRQINSLLAEEFIKGNDIELPHKLGRLELRKFEKRISFRDGKVYTNLPIDWDRTLKLWADDNDAYKEKVLVRMEEDEIFKVVYNKSKANYNNKSFYEFNVNRDLKKRLKQRIKEGLLDAFTYG